MRAQFRVVLLLPNVAKSDLRIRKEIADGVDLRGVHTTFLQTTHQPASILITSPLTNQFIQTPLIFFPKLHCEKATIRKPDGPIGRATKAFPLLLIPTANRTPLAIATGVATMRRDQRITITIPARNNAIGGIVEECAAQELQTGFILRKVDVNTFSRSQAVIEGRQNGNPTIRNRNE